MNWRDEEPIRMDTEYLESWPTDLNEIPPDAEWAETWEDEPPKTAQEQEEQEEEQENYMTEVSIKPKKNAPIIEGKIQEVVKQQENIEDIAPKIPKEGIKFKFPCSEKEMGKLMSALGIDGISESGQSYSITINKCKCKELEGLTIEAPNLRELNFLAQKLGELPKKDAVKVDKILELAKTENPEITPKDVINFVYNKNNYTMDTVNGCKTELDKIKKIEALVGKGNLGETVSEAEKLVNSSRDGGKCKVLKDGVLLHKKGPDKEIYKSVADIGKLSVGPKKGFQKFGGK